MKNCPDCQSELFSLEDKNKDIFVKAKNRVEKLAEALGRIGIAKGILPTFQVTQQKHKED